MRVRLKNPQEFQELIIKAGYSQRAFGREIGISEPFANQIATGERNPSPRVAKKICEALEVSFDDIFFIEGACKSKLPLTGTED